MRGPDEIFKPPSPALLALEARAGLEFVSFVWSLPLLEQLPRGDGHPVLILPGWLAADSSTLTLRWFLRRRGYHVHGWRLGRNFGPAPDVIQRLGDRFHSLRQRHGRKVSLIGWSLGGVYAREIARAFPQDVRQVITLVSPFRDPMASTAATVFARSRPGGESTWDREDLRRRLGRPLPMPATSIYTKSDAIVAWRSCLEPDGPFSENIEVFGSHVGMGHHPLALWVVADRLAQPQGAWRPFQTSFWSRWLLGLAAARPAS